jgi:hypothetical protein
MPDWELGKPCGDLTLIAGVVLLGYSCVMLAMESKRAYR